MYITSETMDKLSEDFDLSQREGRGGQTFNYVSANKIIMRLNEVLGLNWSFEVVEKEINDRHVVILGRLSVYNSDINQWIKREQYGRSEIKRRRDNNTIIDIGDDCKIAVTDCLKKIATLLGVALELNSTPAPIQDSQKEEIKQLLTQLGAKIPSEERFATMTAADAASLIEGLKSKIEA